jgi:hypothetical protein
MTLRTRIFRLVEERERAGISVMPTAGQIADVLGEPLRNIVVTLRSSEAMGQVWLARGLNEKDEDIPVMLKPPAYIYLESAMNGGD